MKTTGQFNFNFLKKDKLVVFEDWGGAQWTRHRWRRFFYRKPKKKAWRYSIGLLAKFYRSWSGGAQIRKNPLFGATFEGLVKSLKEDKEPQITRPEKFIYSTFYLLINPDNFSLEEFFQICFLWKIVIFRYNSKSGENTKGKKLPNPNWCRSWMEYQIMNLRVVVYSQ